MRYPKGCKDLNDALMKYGVAGVKKAIEEHSNWMPVSGVYKMSDLPPSPSRPTYALGMGAFDDHMKIRLGDFAVWSGVPAMASVSGDPSMQDGRPAQSQDYIRLRAEPAGRPPGEP